MERLFLDTNVIIRYLTKDDPDKARRSRSLLKQAEENRIELITIESVIVEAVQVLSSRALYHQPRPQVAVALTTILSLKGVRIPHKAVYRRALILWSNSSVDFVDALLVAHMERQKLPIISSFDRDFDRFPGITRREP